MRQYGWHYFFCCHVMFWLSVDVVLSSDNCSHRKPIHYTPLQECLFHLMSPGGREFPYKQCQYNERRKRWWCATGTNYCTDRMYNWCPRTKSTYGGTAPGQFCHFPFNYLGKIYTHCTKDGTPRLRSYYWCATRPNYHENHWTRCDVGETDYFPCVFRSDGVGIEKACSFIKNAWQCRTEAGMLKNCESTEDSEGGNDPGRACHFPFYLHGVQKFECQKSSSENEVYEWCSTTGNFDRDQLWTRCKRQSGFMLQGLPLVIVIICTCIFTMISGLCVSHYLWKTLHNIFLKRSIQHGSSHADIPRNKEGGGVNEDAEVESARRVAFSGSNISSPPSYDEVCSTAMLASTHQSIQMLSHYRLHNFTSYPT